MTRRSEPRRGAFTLIELLVVIAIIAILSALTMAAVQKVRERGRDVQARSDIQQLEAALTAFKAKFGVYPPCSGSGPQGTFMLCTVYADTDPELAIIKQMFPRVGASDNGLRKLSGTVPTPMQSTLVSHRVNRNELYLDPNQCMVFFLSGGVFTGYTGFGTNPSHPFAAPDTSGAAVSGRLYNGPFFEGFTATKMLNQTAFDESYFINGNPQHARFTSPATDPAVSGAGVVGGPLYQPWFIDPWGTPYLFYSTKLGNDYPFSAGMNIGPWGGPFSPSTSANTPFYSGSGANLKYENIRSVQIISAGRNKMFGIGGARTAGSGDYALNKAGGDDWSNFQQTPLGTTD